jgi:bis(5'-nucleosyl)-tetraphosphatase (symmetrical)
MAVYIIGDVQGCFSELQSIIQAIAFDPERDTLWFVGDIVNRGPDSLPTLRFIRGLGDRAVCVLGNHDLHLLAAYYAGARVSSRDTLQPVLEAPDRQELMEWLRFRPLIHFDIGLNFGMTHAGIYPGWGVEQACARAHEIERALRGEQMNEFLREMYGNEPSTWSDDLQGIPRLRFITNVFTRMRYLNTDGSLNLEAKGAPRNFKSSQLTPWFECSQRAIKHNRIAFGHWSTLPTRQYGSCFALDSGCLWGGRLTVLRIDKKTPRWSSLACPGRVSTPRKSQA